MSAINTNMASEFWFFSQLHRLGYQALITLGNTKAVDIVVILSDNTRLTFDVKGKKSFHAGSYQYLPNPPYSHNHFFVFVDLEIKQKNEKVEFIEYEPTCFIIEAKNLDKIAYKWESSNTGATGFGFTPSILDYLKSKGIAKKPKKALDDFTKVHCKGNPIDFELYEKYLMKLSDFEDIFYGKK